MGPYWPHLEGPFGPHLYRFLMVIMFGGISIEKWAFKNGKKYYGNICGGHFNYKSKRQCYWSLLQWKLTPVEYIQVI